MRKRTLGISPFGESPLLADERRGSWFPTSGTSFLYVHLSKISSPTTRSPQQELERVIAEKLLSLSFNFVGSSIHPPRPRSLGSIPAGRQ